MNAGWTRENYSSEFSALQKASTSLQCFVSLQVHTSQKMYPSRWRTLRTPCLSAERRICNCTFNTYFNKCTILLFPFQFIYCTLKTHNSRTVANWIHVYMTLLSIRSGIKSWNIRLNSRDTCIFKCNMKP
jgi:hypothetical protein